VNSSLKFEELYNKTPVILQDYDHDGVLVCLTMVLRYYGNYQSISVIRKQSQAGSFGDSIDRLCSMAENCDLSAQVRRIELDQLSQISLPAILHWGLNRFVVITKCTNKLAVIHDPASGKSTISIDELSRHFTGMAIELKPTSNFSKVKENEVFNYRELIGSFKRFQVIFQY
jgi:ATP-binding cassette subfamily B protein RaxB